jgi:hypothetical protein
MMPRIARSVRSTSSAPRAISIAVSEIELGEVAMKMFLAYVLIDAIHAALQDRKNNFLRRW